MASTRNRNTPGNYALEQRAIQNWSSEQTYEHSAQGRPYQTYLPGNGLTPGNFKGNSIINNPTDVETMLFGIRSADLTLVRINGEYDRSPNDLTQPDINTTKVDVQYKQLASMDLFQKPILYAPRPIEQTGNQRPTYLN
jgi:hypothetical protein